MDAISPSSRPSYYDPWASITAAQRATLNPDQIQSIDENSKLRVSIDQQQLAVKTGAIAVQSAVPQPIKLTTAQVSTIYHTTDVLKSHSTTTLADVQKLLAPKIVETQEALLGNAETIAPENLNDMISYISDKIKSGAFNGMDVHAANGTETTTSATVFLGWLQARAGDRSLS